MTLSPTPAPCTASSRCAASRTGPREGELVRQAEQQLGLVRTGRRAATARLQADEPAAGRGDADRAGAVVAVRHGDAAGRDERGRAAARAAGAARRIPGVACDAVAARLGREADDHLGHVRDAERRQPGGAEAAHDLQVARSDGALEEVAAHRERHALGDRAGVLDEEGDAGERPVGGVVQRRVEQRHRQRVQRAVDRTDRLARDRHHLTLADIAGAEQLPQPDGVVRRVLVDPHAPLAGSRSDGSPEVDVPGAERRRERAVGGADADEDGARRLDAVRPRERQRQPGQRRPAPAARRSAGVGAQRALHRAGDLRRELGDRGGERAGIAARPPVEQQVRRDRGRARPSSPARPGRRPPRTRRRRRPGTAAPARTAPAPGPPIPRRPTAARARARARICDVGGSTPCPRRARTRSSSGLGSDAGAVEHPLDEVDLRLGERRVQPDAPRREPVPARGVDRRGFATRASGRCCRARPAGRPTRAPPRARRRARAGSPRARRGSGGRSRGRRGPPRSGSSRRPGCP